MSDFYDVNSDVVDTIRLRASAARAQGDVVWIAAPSAAGEVLADLVVSSSATTRRAAVALHAIDNGSIGLYAVRGPVQMTVTSGNFTLGHGIETDNAAVEDTAAPAVVNGAVANVDFAVALESGTAVTTLKAYLLGMPYASSA